MRSSETCAGTSVRCRSTWAAPARTTASKDPEPNDGSFADDRNQAIPCGLVSWSGWPSVGREKHRVHAVACAKLAIDRRKVTGNGSVADVEGGCDLSVREAFGDQLQDLTLAGRQ